MSGHFVRSPTESPNKRINLGQYGSKGITTQMREDLVNSENSINDSTYAYVLGGPAAAKKDNQNCSNFVDNSNKAESK